MKPVQTTRTALKSRRRSDEKGIPLDGIPFHPYYTVKDIVGVVVFLMVFSAIMFFRRKVAAISRVQQLLPGRSAEDPAAHRAGLVFHAVLLNSARHGG